jgi:heme iron utilization protein
MFLRTISVSPAAWRYNGTTLGEAPATGRLLPLARSAIDRRRIAAFFVPDMTEDTSHGVRELVRRLDRAALATALAQENGTWPYASLVLVAVDHDLSPLLLMSERALHSRAIGADNRISLLFDGTAGLDQPLTGPRVTLLGRAAPTDDPRLRQRFLARHPDAAMYADFGDFRFYRVALERAHLVGGFGKIRWLTRDELMPGLPPRALVESEAGIVAHMNDDHADALDLYAGRLLGLGGTGWRMTGIDRDGIDLRRAGGVARLALPDPVDGPDSARKALIALVAKARAAA